MDSSSVDRRPLDERGMWLPVDSLWSASPTSMMSGRGDMESSKLRKRRGELAKCILLVSVFVYHHILFISFYYNLMYTEDKGAMSRY